MLREDTVPVGHPTPVLCVSGELAPDLLERVATPVRVVIGDDLLAAVARCHEFMLEAIASGRSIYGATTGFGPLVSFAGREQTADQCDNTLAHLTTGHGVELEPAIVRAALLARLWSLAPPRLLRVAVVV